MPELFKRDYSSYDVRNLRNDFTIFDFNYLNNDSDVNQLHDNLLEDIITLEEKHVPLIKCTIKNQNLKQSLGSIIE